MYTNIIYIYIYDMCIYIYIPYKDPMGSRPL